MFLEASGGVKMRRMQKKQIECAAADLSPAYTKAVREDLPNSVLVYDRFHIMQMLHRTITDCRRTIYRKLPDETARRAIKGSRFILLKDVPTFPGTHTRFRLVRSNRTSASWRGDAGRKIRYAVFLPKPKRYCVVLTHHFKCIRR